MKVIFKPNKHAESNGNANQESTWTVIPSTHGEVFDKAVQKRLHKNNQIKTTKYTVINFLPKNLFEQFHRFANMYFLFIIVLNWIPAINAFGKEIAMFPLLFVLAVTAVKDIIEDRVRYQSDKEVNNRLCYAYDRSAHKFIQKKWRLIEVGDIVQLFNDEIIPADILLLNTSDENGLGHVSTANLDGETNLKQKQIPKGFLDVQEEEAFDPEKIRYHVKCEPPNNQIHSFYGYISYSDSDGKQLGVDKNNLLLRGCVLKNTQSVTGIVVYAGHETKAMLNNTGPRYKRSQLEKDINKDVIGCVAILFVFCLIGAIGCGVWTRDFLTFEQTYSTNEQQDPAYEGFLRFWTFIIVLQVIIPISLYVSVEIVKLGQVYFINHDRQLFYEHSSQYKVCRATNIHEDLGQIKYVFSDKTGTVTENVMVFKRFTLGGINCPHPEDESEEVVKRQCSMLHTAVTSKGDSVKLKKTWDEFFTALTICNTVAVSEQPVVVNNGSPFNMLRSDIKRRSASAADLRSLTYKNHLSTVSLNLENVDDEEKLYKQVADLPPVIVIDPAHDGSRNGHVTLMEDSMENGSSSDAANDLTADTVDTYVVLTTPRSVNVKVSSKRVSDRLSRSVESISSWLLADLAPKYEAESPDELALVEAATLYGYKLASRTPDQIFFTTPRDEIKVYDILHILQFDSARKRMSVIVRDEAGNIKLYSKGADTAILFKLREGQEELDKITNEHLEDFAREGLRTLCVAKRDLTEDEYNRWLLINKEAELSLTDRDEKLAAAAEMIEASFELLGATGIEDKLQEGVPETIASLRQAGIKVWILTGDKQATAVNIGFSCKLLDANMEIITVNSKTKSECNDLLDNILQRINSKWPSYTVLPTSKLAAGGVHRDRPPLALIIDGATLALALQKPLDQKLIDIARHCVSVVCCRAAPLQKAAVVRLVRENLKVMTLAIGDGANDVSMLQVAEVGVGIAGQEGMQAVMASDFVLGRFRFLKNLMLLHGFWCYDRTARMIIYFFYKNAMFVALLFWFQIFNGFSGSNAIDDLSLIFFNLVFTSLPPIIAGVWDQNLPSEVVARRPLLYAWGQLGKAYTRKIFWITMLDAIFQSLVLFYVPYLTLHDWNMGMRSAGVLFHQLAVLTVSVHWLIETPNWTGIHIGMLSLSVLISYVWFFFYNGLFVKTMDYWAIYEDMKTAEFWLLCLFCPVFSLMPRFVFRVLQSTFWPSMIQSIKISVRYHGNDVGGEPEPMNLLREQPRLVSEGSIRTTPT